MAKTNKSSSAVASALRKDRERKRAEKPTTFDQLASKSAGTTWGSVRASQRAEIRGCVTHGTAHDQHAEVIVRGDSALGMGHGKWCFEVVSARGLTAKSNWTYEASEEAQRVGAQVADALLNIAHGHAVTRASFRSLQCDLLREVLKELDNSDEFGRGSKGELRERVRALVEAAEETK